MTGEVKKRDRRRQFFHRSVGRWQGEVREATSAYQALRDKAAPRAVAVIETLARAAAKGRLNESDLVLLEGIARLLEKANAEKP